MNYIVYDLEWDNASKREIVEIGAVKLAKVNNELVQVGQYQSYVKPVLSHYSYYCENLTGISKEIIDNSRTFPEVIEEFIAWVGEEPHAFISWGDKDQSIFRVNCNMNQINIENWMSVNNDIQHQITLLFGLGKDQKLGLKKAIEMIELPISEDNYHRADFDAKCTSQIFTIFFDKLKINENVKNIKPFVKQEKTNMLLFCNRKSMAAWSEDRFDAFLKNLPLSLRQEFKSDEIMWEKAKEDMKQKIIRLIKSNAVQEMIKQDRETFYLWAKENHRKHIYVLMNAYEHKNFSDEVWEPIFKKHLYRLTFCSKSAS